MRAQEIERIVSKITNISLQLLHTKAGCKNVCEARFMVFYFRKKYLKHSYNSMAKEWGYSNHSSISSGMKAFRGHIETEKELRELVNFIDKLIAFKLPKLIMTKKIYNDHYLLKETGVAVDAKLKLVSICEDKLNALDKTGKKRVNRLVNVGYGVQFEFNYELLITNYGKRMPKALTMPTGRQEVKKHNKKYNYEYMYKLF